MPTERVSDPDDPRLADFAELRDPAWRRRRGLFVVEGRESLRVLLEVGGFALRAVLLTPAAHAELERALALQGPELRVWVGERATLSRIAGVRFHQGCLALAARPPPRPPEALLDPLGPLEAALLLGLEDVTDPDNVGGLFRNAFAFGVNAVLLSGRCADPLYRKAIRTSLGATLRVPFARAEDWPGTLARLGRAGFSRVALTPRASAERLEEADLRGRIALLVGNEGEGLDPATLDAADRQVRIPLAEGADSLNVATAAALALHRIRTRLGSGG